MHLEQIQFIGWQTGIEGEPLFPLFNVVGGPYDGSTVSDKTLKSWGVEVPDFGKEVVSPSVGWGGPAAKASLCRQAESGR